MLNPDLDIHKLKDEFSRSGRVVIRDILEEDVARELYDDFSTQSWRMQVLDRSQKNRLELPLDQPLDPSNPLGILAYIGQSLDYVKQQINLDDLLYIRQVVDIEKTGAGILNDFPNFLNSDEFINTMKEVTGKTSVVHVTAEATCYSKGCFLGEHDDYSDSDNNDSANLVAYVFYLSPVWKAEWGGILMFHDGMIAPQWNTLALFTVPVKHFVSSVSPAATKNRYSITGWLKK